MAGPLKIAKTRFRDLVNKADVMVPNLPLVHSTDTYILEEVLAAGRLEPQVCDVFSGELLTYFFYGRPAFRPGTDASPSGMGHYLPVCLILKPTLAISIKRIFPFDSGAFESGFYKNFLHQKMNLADFGLEPDVTTPGRVVSRFFGSNSAYLKAEPAVHSQFDPAEFEAACYAALISSKEGNSIDSRGSGIEVQSSEAIDINTMVEAVVLPADFASGATGERLKAVGVTPLPYFTFQRLRPDEYTSDVMKMCLYHFINIGLVKETDLHAAPVSFR